jgi:hypothetical protein
VLLVFGAPCQLRLLAGQEHGRTIPLTDSGRCARNHAAGPSTPSVKLNKAVRMPSPECESGHEAAGIFQHLLVVRRHGLRWRGRSRQGVVLGRANAAAGGTAWPTDCWPDRAVRQATMVARTGNLFCWLRQPLELSFVGSEPVPAL